MDRHDEEFETFLRQFRLRKVRPLPEIVSIKHRSSSRWIIAAAAAVVLVGVLSMHYFRNVDRVTGPKATVAAAGSPSLYKAGETINAGSPIRSNSAEGLMLALDDGSQIEMHSRSELALEAAADGIRVKLNDGSILVTAAKQRSGHLYVQTRDALVSVVGTVFFVSAEHSGTRVGVVEGEVQVKQGETLNQLHPGEQVATNSSIQLKSVTEEISWSRSAPLYAATLSQFVPPLVAQNPNPESPTPQEKIDRSPAPVKVLVSYIKQGGEEVRTLITVELMTRDLAFQDVNGAETAEANITGVIYRADNRRIPGFSYPLKVQFPSQSARDVNLDKPNLYQETRYLLPGTYRLNLTVEDKNSRITRATDVFITVPRIPNETLQASSMILAYSVSDLPPRTAGTELFALGGKKVLPNVSGTFRMAEKLNVWQEFYGLAVDSTTHKPSAAFELMISQAKQEIRKLVNGSVELEGSQRMNYTNSVPLTDFPPGQYDVQLKVTDNIAKQTLVTMSRFSVIGSPATQSDPPKDDPGRMIFNRACTTCHSANDAARGNYTTKYAYETLIARERGFGAMLSDAEVPLLVDYLFNTYGKKSAPPDDLPVQRK